MASLLLEMLVDLDLDVGFCFVCQAGRRDVDVVTGRSGGSWLEYAPWWRAQWTAFFSLTGWKSFQEQLFPIQSRIVFVKTIAVVVRKVPTDDSPESVERNRPLCGQTPMAELEGILSRTVGLFQRRADGHQVQIFEAFAMSTPVQTAQSKQELGDPE